MLINQARNLASLPYSSLQQLQQSIQRTQQLLTQAQRIAYNVTHDRPGVHARPTRRPIRPRPRPAADRRRADPLADLARRVPGRAEGPGRRRSAISTPTAPRSRAGHVEPVGDRRAAGGAGRQSARRAADPAARGSHRRHGGDRAAPRAWKARARSRARTRRRASSAASSTTAPAISPPPRRCSTDARTSARPRRLGSRARLRRRDGCDRSWPAIHFRGGDSGVVAARRASLGAGHEPTRWPELARCQTIGMAAAGRLSLRPPGPRTAGASSPTAPARRRWPSDAPPARRQVEER